MNQESTYRFPFASYPALRLVLLLIAGICFGHASNGVSYSHYLIVFSGLISLWVVVEFLSLSKLSLWKTFFSNLLYLMMVVVFGAALISAEKKRGEQLRQKTSTLQLYEWESIEIKGVIYSRGKSSTGRNVYELEVRETRFPENLVWNQPYKIRLYGIEGNYRVKPTHNNIEAEVELYAFPEKRNPHEFDYGEWLLSRSITAHGELVQIRNSNPANEFGWSNARQKILQTIDSLFTTENASLAKALFIGYKKELTDETRQSFSRAGLSHIMAVSGMHVGFIVAPFWLLIPWLWRWRWGKYFGLFLLTLLLFSYAGITGFSASVSRASIMAWLLTYGKLFQKLRQSVNLLAVAALILLLISPSEIYDIGFQLSFSAVLIILLIMPEAQRLIPLRYRYNRLGALMTIVLISVIVQLGLFPILAIYFGEFSIMGPIANALVVPLLCIVVPVGLLLSVAGYWLIDVASLISIPIEWSLTWIGEVATHAGGTSWSYLTIAEISPWLFPLWIILVLMISALRLPTIRWKLTILLLICVNLLLIDSMMSRWENNRLIVTALDVGQGDAIHIKTPLGKHILVDAGRWSPGGNSGERTIIPYLKDQNIDEIDAVILSHPHADHVGGMPDLIRDIPINTIYQSAYPYDSRLYETYMSLADSMNVSVQTVYAGDMIDVDPNIRLFVLGPEDNASGMGNINNASVSLRLDYRDISFLFTGDAEAAQEQQLVSRYGDFLDTDVLKTGHHGSKTSSTTLFVDSVTPEITFTSLAYQNRFGHPHQMATLRLAQTGAKNYFTSLSGALIFKSDGTSISRKQSNAH